MTEAIETVKYKKHTIEIFPDEHCENPIQTWDVLGEYLCWHRRYNLGNSDRFTTPDEVVAYARQTQSLLFPLFLYDHSGIVLSLSNSHYPFTDQWDAGQLGFILVDREKVLKEFGKKRLTKQLKQKIGQIIEGEVETYNQYLAGDVYGYVVSRDNEHIDSCWGYYGQDDCLSEARSIVDYEVEKAVKKHCQKVKQWIRSKVPLIYRSSLVMC